MPHGIIAKKLGMSRFFLENGEAIPVTYLKVDPNTVVRTKTQEKDGYNAVVLGIGARQWTSRKGKEHTRYGLQKEWQVESLEGLDAGAVINVDTIPVQSVVTITGVSKGKGYQGVVKRHGFAGGPASHGSHFHRRGGSIGMRALPGRVHKGKRMGGRMGGDTVTIKHREVVLCDAEKGVLGVRGPVPGPNGASVFVTIESAPSS